MVFFKIIYYSYLDRSEKRVDSEFAFVKNDFINFSVTHKGGKIG